MVTVEKEAPVTSPAPSHTVDTGNARQITLDILNRLFGAALPRTAAIQLWGGARWPESAPGRGYDGCPQPSGGAPTHIPPTD